MDAQSRWIVAVSSAALGLCLSGPLSSTARAQRWQPLAPTPATAPRPPTPSPTAPPSPATTATTATIAPTAPIAPVAPAATPLSSPPTSVAADGRAVLAATGEGLLYR